MHAAVSNNMIYILSNVHAIAQSVLHQYASLRSVPVVVLLFRPFCTYHDAFWRTFLTSSLPISMQINCDFFFHIFFFILQIAKRPTTDYLVFCNLKRHGELQILQLFERKSPGLLFGPFEKVQFLTGPAKKWEMTIDTAINLPADKLRRAKSSITSAMRFWPPPRLLLILCSLAASSMLTNTSSKSDY